MSGFVKALLFFSCGPRENYLRVLFDVTERDLGDTLRKGRAPPVGDPRGDETMPMAHRPGVYSATLTALRRRRCLHSKDLADLANRDEGYLSRLETKEEPSYELLVELAVGVMKYDLEELESTVHGLTRGTEPMQIPDSPIPVTEEEVRAIRRAAGPLGRAVTEAREELLLRELRAAKVRQAREEAEELCKTLLGSQGKMRRLYIETGSEYQTWAVAERLCELSTKAARESAGLALEVARLAYRVAEMVRGEEKWRARVRGYCLAFVANAWRVLGQLKKAERIFVRSLELWAQGVGGDPDRILPEWRLPDLEASLRRDQGRFAEALELHKRAQAAAARVAWGRILLNKANTLNQMLEAEEALQVLREAAPLIEEAKDSWLREGLGYLMCVNLCHLCRYEEAEGWLRVAWPVDPRNERELIRVRLLSGRVAAGLGQIASSLETFGVVRQFFEKEKNAYIYAQVSLEEATHRLDLGQYAKVQEMVVRDMAWVFHDVGIHREALAALTLFRGAMEGARATGALARQVHHYLVQAEKNPDLRFEA